MILEVEPILMEINCFPINREVLFYTKNKLLLKLGLKNVRRSAGKQELICTRKFEEVNLNNLPLSQSLFICFKI